MSKLEKQGLAVVVLCAVIIAVGAWLLSRHVEQQHPRGSSGAVVIEYKQP